MYKARLHKQLTNGNKTKRATDACTLPCIERLSSRIDTATTGAVLTCMALLNATLSYLLTMSIYLTISLATNKEL